MATILLSAAGAAIGQGIGGTVMGLATAVAGRAVGAVIGRSIDQKLLGGGSRAVETGGIDRLRLQTAGEGAPVARLWGQMRVPGHVIWAAPLEEVRQTKRVSGGGKGAPRTSITEISYLLSAAFSLCEGPILGVGRVWAEGEEISPDELGMSVYHGDEEQLPDPVIAAFEGEEAPAYRGIAYVVLDRLDLGRWGNRVPQLSFEVTRTTRQGEGMAHIVQAVAMIPGTGEYSLATRPVGIAAGLGETRMMNANTALAATDFEASLKQLETELPNVGSVSLVVSWFGDDLRASHCKIMPKVEDSAVEGDNMVWRAGGIGRQDAQMVARKDGRPVYGGTPADDAVLDALRLLTSSGKKAVFYPFILMEQQEGNALPDPYGGEGQPVMPWRGRLTSDIAAGHSGTAQGSADAEVEVAAFFGKARAADFRILDGQVRYHGPQEWGYRRFILHYAYLCKLAGGIDAFLIGSEMVGLTQICGAAGKYPAVDELIRLAADVRLILGPETKISYAADWTEYFGHKTPDGDLFYHLDPLWSHDDIDFVGIDNYMPLSDWRHGDAHLDAQDWRHIHDPEYLMDNIQGGEGYDWYYASDDDRDAQIRTPITDGAYGEPWVWRYKDLGNWWSQPHHERISGRRSAEPTGWKPASKPIWFTEIGCAAIDLGTNQPNKFLDAHSSESQLPYSSEGVRDDAMQAAYLVALSRYWTMPGNNPVGEYGGPMLDVARSHVWAWDARPFPAFPSNTGLWSDGPAWSRGHWLNGRASAVRLADLVTEICLEAGLAAVDASGLVGQVKGFVLTGAETARAALQQLMLGYGFDAVERGGKLVFRMRSGRVDHVLTPEMPALAEGLSMPEFQRASKAEVTGRLRLNHIAAGGHYDSVTAEARLPGDGDGPVGGSELSLALTRPEGRHIVSRWLAEARIARDTMRVALPPSAGVMAAGDVVELADKTRWRIDRLQQGGHILVEAVRIEAGLYHHLPAGDDLPSIRPYAAPIPVWHQFLDLPLISGDEVPHAARIAAAAKPWPDSVAVWVSQNKDSGYAPLVSLPEPALMGVTLSPLVAAPAGVVDRGPALRVKLSSGDLQPASGAALFAGANMIAIGDGRADRWEVFQFAHAEPAGGGEWLLSVRLRGQAGTDAVMPQVWPAGSKVVLLDARVVQLPLAPASRAVPHHYRIGPATRPHDDASYRHSTAVFTGVGLRPLSPCHLRVDGRHISWIRRTRIDGDGWAGHEVPLGEENEAYLLRFMREGAVLASQLVTQPEWEVPSALWGDLQRKGSFVVDVAQLSTIYGPGLSARRVVDV